LGKDAAAPAAAARTRVRLPDVRAFLRWLKPLDGGPNEIRAVDGLRALAALGVVIYHAIQLDPRAFKINLAQWWWYPYAGQTGVDLFFVLSGFLLFLPFARALLDSRPLPDTRRFFTRRAQRILPAYIACMAIMVAVQWSQYGNATGALDVGAHLLFIHDMIPPFNNAINGVFWTLALEGQFYLMLPVLAAVFAKAMRSSRSPRRLFALLLAFIAATLVLREAGAALAGLLPALQGKRQMGVEVLTMLLVGVQGKYFELFGLGMVCSLVYILLRERRMWPARATVALGSVLFALSLIALFIICQLFGLSVLHPVTGYTSLRGDDVVDVLTPLLLGLAYAALLLGVLLGGRIIRAPFELGSLCFLGIISYSIYLWHAPAIWAMLPFTASLHMWQRVVVGLILAYLSYTLVEKPFLRRRQSQRAQATRVPTAVELEFDGSIARTASVR